MPRIRCPGGHSAGEGGGGTTMPTRPVCIEFSTKTNMCKCTYITVCPRPTQNILTSVNSSGA